MNAPDIIERCIAVFATVAKLTDDQKFDLDLRLRKEVGSADVYIPKRSPLLRDVIRARYDGTMATTRVLAAEFEVSETTVRRIGMRRRLIAAAVAPAVTPRLAGKARK